MNKEVVTIFSELILSDKKLRIKLLGDSITHGVGGSGWQQNGDKIIEGFARSPESHCWANSMRDYLEGHYNCEVVNNGCTGININTVIANFDKLVDPEDDIIICTIGTNNRHQNMDGSEKKTKLEFAKALYERILKLDGLFRATGKKYVFVANIPAAPKCECSGANYWRILHMNDIRDLYLKASCEVGFPLIDLYSAFVSYCDLKDMDYTTLLADGLHPNDAGYDIMFKLLLSELGFGKSMIN